MNKKAVWVEEGGAEQVHGGQIIFYKLPSELGSGALASDFARQT